MSTQIVIESALFVHESGTKFYEVLQIHATDVGQHLLVKRWGKSSAMNSQGGEIQVAMHPSARKLGGAAAQIVRQKEGRGYGRTSSGHGLHGYGGEVTSDNLLSLLTTHYGSDHAATIRTVFDKLDMIRGTKISGAWVDESADIVSEEPTPEPIRDASWGSW